MGSGVEQLDFHDLHLPDEVRVFAVPGAAVRRWDDEALVYDVRVPGGGALRHYSFYRRWFEVNCSLSPDGRFMAEPGPIEWSFNCDICTPCFSFGPAVYSVDLALDVLVGPDAHNRIVKDEDAFDGAVARGWLSATEATGARRGLDELLGLIDTGRFLAFLVEVCPFDRGYRPPKQPPPERLRMADVPLLARAGREAWYGRRI
ncbi:MAG: hypothetical protein ACYC6V_07585 [Bacillota bacterium]